MEDDTDPSNTMPLDVLEDEYPEVDVYDTQREDEPVEYIPWLAILKFKTVSRTIPFGRISRYTDYPNGNPNTADVLFPHALFDPTQLPSTKSERLFLYLKDGPLRVRENSYKIENKDSFEMFTPQDFRDILPRLMEYDIEQNSRLVDLRERIALAANCLSCKCALWDSQHPGFLEPHFKDVAYLVLFLAKNHLFHPWRIWYLNHKVMIKMAPDFYSSGDGLNDACLIDLYGRYARAGGPPLASWAYAISRMFSYLQKRVHTFEQARGELVLSRPLLYHFSGTEKIAVPQNELLARAYNYTRIQIRSCYWELKTGVECEQWIDENSLHTREPDVDGTTKLGFRRPAHRAYTIIPGAYTPYQLLNWLLTRGPLALAVSHTESLHCILTYDQMVNFDVKVFRKVRENTLIPDAIGCGEDTEAARLRIITEMFEGKMEGGEHFHTPAPLQKYLKDPERMYKFLAKNYLHHFARIWYMDVMWFGNLDDGYTEENWKKLHDVVLMSSYARYTRYGGERLTTPSKMFPGETHPVKRITMYLDRLAEGGDNRFRMYGSPKRLPVYIFDAIKVNDE